MRLRAVPWKPPSATANRECTVTSRFLLGAAGAAVFAVLAGAAPASAQNGQALFAAKGCVACHGADAKKPLLPTYPKVAGQNAPYLVLALKAYKAQERKGEAATTMWGMAAQLNDSEMQQIADYLSKLQ
jgi:cytochrome c